VFSLTCVLPVLQMIAAPVSNRFKRVPIPPWPTFILKGAKPLTGAQPLKVFKSVLTELRASQTVPQ